MREDNELLFREVLYFETAALGKAGSCNRGSIKGKRGFTVKDGAFGMDAERVRQIRALKRRLRSFWASKREAAVREVAELEGDVSELLPALFQRLGDKNPQVVQAAIDAFVAIGERAVEILLFGLRGNLATRHAVREALRRIGRSVRAELARLALKRGNPIQAEAVSVLARAGPRSFDVLFRVLEREVLARAEVEDRESGGAEGGIGVVREGSQLERIALEAISKMAPAVLGKLRAKMKHENFRVRASVMAMLGRAGPIGAELLVAEGFTDPSEVVRNSAEQALVSMQVLASKALKAGLRHSDRQINLHCVSTIRLKMLEAEQSGLEEELVRFLCCLPRLLVAEDTELRTRAASLVLSFRRDEWFYQGVIRGSKSYTPRQREADEITRRLVEERMISSADKASAQALQALNSAEEEVRRAAVWIISLAAPHAAKEVQEPVCSALMLLRFGGQDKDIQSLASATLLKITGKEE